MKQNHLKAGYMLGPRGTPKIYKFNEDTGYDNKTNVYHKRTSRHVYCQI